MKQGDWDLLTAQIWAVALVDLGMNERSFAKAYRRSLSQPWLPTTPHDFAALAVDFTAYPDCHSAYLDAACGIFKHPVAYETANRLGIWQLRTKPERETYPQWLSTYTKVCTEHAAGAKFTMPNKSTKAISQKITRKPLPEHIEQQVSQFLARMSRKTITTGANV